MSTLLRDVIHIPETAGADDYVLRLTEGVGRGRLAETLREYVVTDDIATAFDQALDLVGDAIRRDISRGAFLTGSFGSGKSHFMAVLHALLGHEPAARAMPELAPLVAKHDAALRDRKILRLAYHMLGAESLEQAVLGGYVAQIRVLHPDADLPAVYRTGAVLADAERLRAQLGDDVFLAGLDRDGSPGAGGGQGGDDVWGSVLGTGSWTSDSYDAARAAAPGSEARQRLLSALVRSYFTAYTVGAEFVDIDTGLAAISAHAKGLGYDAVVLFLDELVLWLAFGVRDATFFRTEAPKITKLVESAAGTRPAPLISFVARQMDLRRYFSEAGAARGADQEALESAFRHQEGRFRSIVLGDDNLPFVAERRLLAPVDDRARAVLDDAFRGLDRRPAVWDVLLDGVNVDDRHRGSDQHAFRRTYPFSPALVSTLRTLASAMQRERTALKVMQQVLVRQRDTLTVDDVIPVGDVFDLVVVGDVALTPEMGQRFKAARTLYEERLRPVLLREHRLDTAEAAGLGSGHPLRADERLAKTLVLAAVAPSVPALRELTASRIAALNHGSIVSPLPGEEATTVIGKVTRWSGEVPEIKVGTGRDPVIRVQLADVDYESVVERAKGEDNEGRRRQALKELVWDALSIREQAQATVLGVVAHPITWRGSRRDVEVLFGNVRDTTWLSDAHFSAGHRTWRVVVDYPFDEDGRSARDDLDRLDDLRAGGLTSRTLVWLPRFLSAERKADLGRLVVLDWLLGGTGERWTAHCDHLAEAERSQARIILDNQREALRQRLRQALQESYGAARSTSGNLEEDAGHDRVLVSLDPGFQPALPVGGTLGDAFANLLDQAFSATYPEHPAFEPGDRGVGTADLAAVLRTVEEAVQQRDGRLPVADPRVRDRLRWIANPLGVGHMSEQAFLVGPDRFTPWGMALAKAMGAAGLAASDVVTVGQLRAWVAAVPRGAGLLPEVADLVVCTWAALESRAWYRHGAPVTPAPQPGRLSDDMELRSEPLPAPEDYAAAVDRAGAVFGAAVNPHRTGANVSALAESLRKAAGAVAEPAQGLVGPLEQAYGRLGLPTAETQGRLATARAATALVTAIRTAPDNVAVVERTARRELPAPDVTVSVSLRSAADVARACQDHPWERLDAVLAAEGTGGDRARAAKRILDDLRAALRGDEQARPLRPALRAADDAVFDWLRTPPPAPAPTPQPTPQPTRPSPQDRRTLRPGEPADDVARALVDFRFANPDRPIVVEWRVEP